MAFPGDGTWEQKDSAGAGRGSPPHRDYDAPPPGPLAGTAGTGSGSITMRTRTSTGARPAFSPSVTCFSAARAVTRPGAGVLGGTDLFSAGAGRGTGSAVVTVRNFRCSSCFGNGTMTCRTGTASSDLIARLADAGLSP